MTMRRVEGKKSSWSRNLLRDIDRQNRCAQRAGGIAGRGVLGRREGRWEGGKVGRWEGGAGDSAQCAARSTQGVGWMLWNSVERCTGGILLV